MKLNNKRTFLVGFAFFLICAFWQAYDTLVPLMLVNRFGMNQTWSGLIMALDNIFALFMLPLFGALSDKKNTKLGKRTPFILIGTICAVICFVGLAFADNAQLNIVKERLDVGTYWENNYEIPNVEYNGIKNNDVPTTYTIRDYVKAMHGDASEQDLKNWFVNEVKFDTVYSYDRNTNAYTVYQNKYVTLDGNGNVTGVYDSEGTGRVLKLVDKNNNLLPDGTITTNAYKTLVNPCESQFVNGITKSETTWLLVVFIVLLLGALVSMATFRSPAVALMPDVTVKPLRSKANAIINLMGTVGGLIILVFGIVFGTGNVKNQMMSYVGFIFAVAVLMIGALVVFMLTVKEKRWNEEMLAEQAKLDEESDEEESESGDERLPKDKRKSLIFILASVALWFIGYNAITSKYSLYALNELNKDYNTTLIIAQGAALISYIPVGILASKIGRKKSILSGIVMLTVAFTCASFVTSTTPTIILWVLFALAGIGWATINVNSFPMVVELSKGGNIGKYTGFYYTASMAAQIVTPILSGFLMDSFHTMRILFPYGATFAALSFVTMLFVKHGDAKPETPQDKLEMLAGADD